MNLWKKLEMYLLKVSKTIRSNITIEAYTNYKFNLYIQSLT